MKNNRCASTEYFNAQLNYVDDPVTSSNYGTDIDDQSANNYLYDSIGNLVKDVSENIDSIIWNVYGKIERVVRSSGTNKSDLEFRYDAMGNRICKIVKPRDVANGLSDQDAWTYTYYMRDASGNVIATYDRNYSTPGGTYGDTLSLTENHLYGSSRTGIRSVSEVVCVTTYTYSSTNANGTFVGSFSSRSATAASTTNFNHEVGKKAYELSNHLGNVLTTVSDARNPVDNSGTVSYFRAVVLSASDYYAFGSSMAGRSYTSSSYRYTFNGKEKDGEFTEGSLDFGARVYESRLGRWMSVDPQAHIYTSLAPYIFVDNSPLNSIDGDGRDIIVLCAEQLAHDPEELHYFGHQAALIGDDEHGWYFYSFDADDGDHNSSTNNDYTSGKYFNSLDEFRNSEYNTYKNDYDDGKGTETSHRDENGKIIQRFTEAYRIKTDVATDEKMKKAAASTFDDSYVGSHNDCTDVVKNALEAGGLKTGEYGGNGNPNSSTGLSNERLVLPEHKQAQIEKLNEGTDVDDKIKRTELHSAGKIVGTATENK